tara:strand:- start:3296 stop:3583 length:288 start_codon:yes stop_codon:yes gene_type:complete
MNKSKKTARELIPGEVVAVMGSRNGFWFVKNWTVESVADYPEFGMVEVHFELHSASDEALRIDSKETRVAQIEYRDEKYEMFTMCNGPAITGESW